MKPWRLTPQAEHSLTEIFIWTIEIFGERQALTYQDVIIDRINMIANNQPPHPRPCAVLMPGPSVADDLTYFREGGHYIILRETDKMVEVLDFLHQNSNLPAHIKRLI
ncbi:MAG: type II toxin-antitoxin system RelE/ParE family toxin [Hellea sp.]|nr:type II toxin-antitoxin system RelE/ParE family toxin [Hellea sp.]